MQKSYLCQNIKRKQFICPAASLIISYQYLIHLASFVPSRINGSVRFHNCYIIVPVQVQDKVCSRIGQQKLYISFIQLIAQFFQSYLFFPAESALIVPGKISAV